MGARQNGQAVPRSDSLTVKGRLSDVIDALSHGVVIVDHRGHVMFVNAAAYRLSGGHVNPSANVRDAEFHRKFSLYDSDGEPLWQRERPLWRALHAGEPVTEVVGYDEPDGSRVWLLVTAHALDPDNPESLLVVSIADVTSYHATADHLTYRATHDHLTGLPNREHTIATLAHYLRARHRRDPLVVMFIDLDELKTINDTFGHSTGDTVLRTSAARLRHALPTTAILGRIGGDEFVAIHLDGIDSLPELTHNLHTALATPIPLAGHQLRVRASIGVVIVPPGDMRSTDHILRRADHAMYRAKSAGGNQTHYLTAPSSVRSAPQSLTDHTTQIIFPASARR
ncbi:sensor domain-containing diguanylate cyclase [Williamsia muralis]|uniref:sensor domain-containing diguanylate cyclase n=1 Tax=Williamsia marianensis TaxID=85044 RepID=UPI000DE76010|nr:sensor domain-containing diguanylate cyclase [Williamsia marianensis]PVY23216.1 diguanylate cyclase (GGDEF)-like protein [Williamsia marianensis]